MNFNLFRSNSGLNALQNAFWPNYYYDIPLVTDLYHGLAHGHEHYGVSNHCVPKIRFNPFIHKPAVLTNNQIRVKPFEQKISSQVGNLPTLHHSLWPRANVHRTVPPLPTLFWSNVLYESPQLPNTCNTFQNNLPTLQQSKWPRASTPAQAVAENSKKNQTVKSHPDSSVNKSVKLKPETNVNKPTEELKKALKPLPDAIKNKTKPSSETRENKTVNPIVYNNQIVYNINVPYGLNNLVIPQVPGATGLNGNKQTLINNNQINRLNF